MRNAQAVVTPYLDRRDAAAYVGISLRGLDILIADEGTPVIRIGARVLLDKADLDALMRAKKTAPAGEQPCQSQ